MAKASPAALCCAFGGATVAKIVEVSPGKVFSADVLLTSFKFGGVHQCCCYAAVNTLHYVFVTVDVSSCRSNSGLISPQKVRRVPSIHIFASRSTLPGCVPKARLVRARHTGGRGTGRESIFMVTPTWKHAEHEQEQLNRHVQLAWLHRFLEFRGR
eukprot:268249-Chlamydomonas_euryale.AAC.2